MKTRTLGNTGRAVGEIGLGTWQLGANWGDVTDEVALATLRGAWDAGTTLFDTADVYGAGRSEKLIGKFLRESPAARAGAYVATKLGRFSPPGWPENFTRAAVRAHTEASLQRLGVETLDLTQFHCIPFEVLQRGEVFEHARELKREGKIRDFGVSVESMAEADFCVRQEGVAALQIIFNLFRQKPVHLLFAEAKKRNVALIVRLPLASGLLGGKMTAADAVPCRTTTATSTATASSSMSARPSRASRFPRASSWPTPSSPWFRTGRRSRILPCAGASISTRSACSSREPRIPTRRGPTTGPRRFRPSAPRCTGSWRNSTPATSRRTSAGPTENRVAGPPDGAREIDTILHP
jgi:aryl-alcohol dehydrogenase-like predicted oxidoreductase